MIWNPTVPRKYFPGWGLYILPAREIWPGLGCLWEWGWNSQVFRICTPYWYLSESMALEFQCKLALIGKNLVLNLHYHNQILFYWLLNFCCFLLSSLWNDRRYKNHLYLQFLAHSSSNPCNCLSDESTRSIFCSKVWALTPAPDTQLLNPLEFPGW